MKTQALLEKNPLYELLKKKYHTSEGVRLQIVKRKEELQKRVPKESLKSFTVNMSGSVTNCSFEKTLKIVSKNLFIKGRITAIFAPDDHEIVEADITATLSEVETLIQYLMIPHVVLHFKKELLKGASNLLIIDESEQNQLGDIIPDHSHRNFITYAELHEKYTGRMGNYLILNGLPLTAEKLGSELRFNKIQTKNKVFTTTGLKEIYVNLYFIFLLLKLDLEQHYLKLRTFNSQTKDLSTVEEKIDDLGFFSDVFNNIATTDNPLLFNEKLFIDLMRIEHIIENNNWKSIPAYAGYVSSASGGLNAQFKFMEDFALFVTYANCVSTFITKIVQKIGKHKSDFRNELHNLTANYNELKKLSTVLNHPILRTDYQEMLNAFSKLLAYLDFSTLDGVPHTATAGKATEMLPKVPGAFITLFKKCVKSVLPVRIDISAKPASHPELTAKTEQEESLQKLTMKLSENLEKISKLKTKNGEDAYLDARRHVPLLTELSDVIDQLAELIRHVESNKASEEPFKKIFSQHNKFEIFYHILQDVGVLETEPEKKAARLTLAELQTLLFTKPLKESAYQGILDKIHALETMIQNKKESKKDAATQGIITKLFQTPIFNTIMDIKAGIKNILEIQAEHQKVDAFRNEPVFFSYNAKELDSFLAEIVTFYEKLGSNCYYKDVKNFEMIEVSLDRLTEELQGINSHISLRTRNKDTIITKEPDAHIDYLRASHLTRKNLEKSIIFLQNQIAQIEGFMHGIEGNLCQHSFVYSGVAASVLFDQITYTLSNIDIRLLDMTDTAERMFREGVDTIFHYQVGEAFAEPKSEEMEGLAEEIEKRTVIRKYGIPEPA
ncbi:MAG: small soluble cyt c [Candidatus Brocadiaceae bacterium]|nr:small soluble cyt c [Candidatus Brocadiaceae bacterium]